MLKLNQVEVAYYNQCILDKVNLEIAPGEIVGLLGKNGAGKSTLLNTISGNIYPRSGEVIFLGERVNPEDFKNKYQMLFMSHDFDLATVLRFSKTHAFLHEKIKTLGAYDLKMMDELIATLEIPNKNLHQLSTGERRKMQLILSLPLMPKLLLIDELMSVLDPESRYTVFNLLKNYCATHHCSLILSTNIFEDLKEFCSQVYYLNEGKLSKYSYEEFESDIIHKKAA